MENKWILPDQKDEDLKTIAKDLYNNKIFCDRHISNGRIESHFMPIIFMGPKEPEKPKYPSEDKDLQGQRDNKLYDLVQREIDQKKYEEDLLLYPIERAQFTEYIKTIGMVYEYLDVTRSPMAINGMPVFLSCRFLTIGDTEKMFNFYEQYKSIRETADKF